MTFVRSHWFWFFAVLTVVSGLDYWDHISRPDSSFEEAPGAWLAFTGASHSSLCVIAFLAAKVLGKLPVPTLLTDTCGVCTAVAAHLVLTGPLWNRMFWDGNLRFDTVLLPVLIASAVYLAYRGVFYAVRRALVRVSR